MVLFHHLTRFSSQCAHLSDAPLLPRGMWADLLATGNRETICCARKRGRNAGAVVGLTTCVTNSFLLSFQPFTVASSSHKASHPRMPHTRDLTSDNPAFSKNFLGPPLVSSQPPPTRAPWHPPVHASLFNTQKAYTEAFGSSIRTPNLMPPSRFYR
jgi:hypothetical protein